MRRLLFVSNLFPDQSEPYRGLDNATVLHALRSRYEIRVLSPRPTLPGSRPTFLPREADAPFAPKYVPALYVPVIGSSVNHRLMALSLRHAVRAAEFDVVLSSWLYPDSCGVAQLAREEGFPFVAIAQGTDVHQYLRMPARKRAILEMADQASAIVTRSAELARLLAEAGVAQKKLHPIFNGIDPTNFHPGDRAAAREGLNWPKDAPTILFVGNFYQIKCVPLLIAAFARLPQDARLVLVGGGPEETRILAEIQRHRLRQRVTLAGRCDAAIIGLMMRAADVLALPSENEGVPNVILEALGCGLPVVASRVGGIPEVHAGDDFGRLVPPGDEAALAEALQAVLVSPPARERIASHGAQFTWGRTAEQYEELLNSA